MKEHGILMYPSLATEVRAGMKTQTRRVIHPEYLLLGKRPDEILHLAPNQVGDLLYIKEAVYAKGCWFKHTDLTGKSFWEFKYEAGPDDGKFFYDDNPPDNVEPKRVHAKPGWHKRSPLFMPKAAARTWLEVTNVRAQRLQDIIEEDAKAEGVVYWKSPSLDIDGWLSYRSLKYDLLSARESFFTLWAWINGEDSLNSNPWVWAYTFKLIEKGGAR